MGHVQINIAVAVCNPVVLDYASTRVLTCCVPFVLSHSLPQQEDFCVLRPLVLVLKSILYQNGLGDVSTGGLGSWSLANMIIANLMVSRLPFVPGLSCHCPVRFAIARTVLVRTVLLPHAFLSQFAALYVCMATALPLTCVTLTGTGLTQPHASCWPDILTAVCALHADCYACTQAEDAAGGQVDHAGHMLLSFLKRYGADWELDRDAVAVAEGGIMPHSSLASPAGGRFAAPGRLAVKDPLTGRAGLFACDLCRYSHAIDMWRVQKCSS
jgi:hypothetical protein